jgi:hypothetical protein
MTRIDGARHAIPKLDSEIGFIAMYVLFCVFCVLFVCECVLYYCHWVSIQFQLKINIIYIR